MNVMARFGRRIDWSALISHRYKLTEVGQALADVEAQRVVKAVIIPDYSLIAVPRWPQTDRVENGETRVRTVE